MYNIVPLQHSSNVRRGINRDAVPLPLQPMTNLPLRSASAPPSQKSPSESSLGLYNHSTDDFGLLGFSAASISSPSNSDSAISPFGVDYHASDFWQDAPTPMTPSRAGAKALQVLGSHTTPAKVEKKSRNRSRRDWDRPMPKYVIF